MSSGAKQVMEQQYKGLRESIRIKCSCSKPICLIHIQLNLHTISSLCIFLPYPWFSNMVFPPVFFVTITPSRCFPPIFFPSCCVCVCVCGEGGQLCIFVQWSRFCKWPGAWWYMSAMRGDKTEGARALGLAAPSCLNPQLFFTSTPTLQLQTCPDTQGVWACVPQCFCIRTCKSVESPCRNFELHDHCLDVPYVKRIIV